jgi:lysophospholipase L1-like esterase
MTMRTLKIYAALLVLLAVFPALGQQAPDLSASNPYDMLVLGDSITWGQGLKKEHKAWYQVKIWLEKTNGCPVIERVEAHSGAVVEGGSMTDSLAAQNAEVNVGLPSINEEVDNALRFYNDGSRVDLVLISGCGNDVGLQNLLNASSREELDRMTTVKCGPPMERLLRKVTTSFPAARVIVVGYYPFFSETTRNDFVTRALARRLYRATADAAKKSSQDIFAQLAANSSAWYESSNKTLAGTVRTVNEVLGTERVTFAKIDFPSDYSFAAKNTHLWGFNRSPFKMMMVFLSFGHIQLPTNDEMRRQRKASCDLVYKAQPNETAEQKRERRNRRLLCRYAALGHPNRKGATLYAAAIMAVLKTPLAVKAR